MRIHRALSFVGGPGVRSAVVTLWITVLFLRGRRWSAVSVLAATAGMGTINTAIKNITRRQRPVGLPGLRQAGGYSFPSGHSSGSVVFLGALAYFTGRSVRHRGAMPFLLTAAAIAAAFIAQSRVVLRAHHRTDVVAGYAVGAAWLGIVLRGFDSRLSREWK